MSCNRVGADHEASSIKSQELRQMMVEPIRRRRQWRQIQMELDFLAKATA